MQSNDAMSLRDRLLNPQRRQDGTLSDDVNIDTMRSAAAALDNYRMTIEAYLAGATSCNGGAEQMFLKCLADNA